MCRDAQVSNFMDAASISFGRFVSFLDLLAPTYANAQLLYKDFLLPPMRCG